MEERKRSMPDFMRMFQGREIDLTQFSRGCEIYTQNTKTTADTIRDNRIDIYIPWKPVLMDGMSVMHEIQTVDVAGANVVAGAGSLWGGLSSACDQIESIQFLHGNGAGDIIYEISGSAYAYL